MSKTVIVHKTEKLVREVPSVTIEISKEILRTDVAPAWDESQRVRHRRQDCSACLEGWRERNEAMFTADANLIADALHSSLPGGTFDCLVAELMRRKASHLTVAHSTGSAAGLKQDDIATCQKCRGESWEHSYNCEEIAPRMIYCVWCRSTGLLDAFGKPQHGMTPQSHGAYGCSVCKAFPNLTQINPARPRVGALPDSREAQAPKLPKHAKEKEMNSPKKLYIVISRECPDETVEEAEQFRDPGGWGAFDNHKEAADMAAHNNEMKKLGFSDWRVETYVKGD